MAKRFWNWNNFRWWISDNPSLWQDWQYQDWLYIDVQSEPNGFKLTSIDSSLYAVNSRPVEILDLADFWSAWVYTFCTWWEIYNWLGNIIYTDVSWSPIIAATWMYSGWTLYLYYFTWIGAIHKISVSWTHTLITTALFTTDSYPIIKYGWDIYFGNKNTFRKLDSAEVLTTIFTASTENTFTAITFFQDSFKLYSRLWDTTNPRDWQQFIIWVNKTSPDYIVKWDRLPILWACNQWATDTVITWAWPNYSDAYLVSWTQRQLLKGNYENMNLWRKFTWKMVSWKDEVILIWHNQQVLSSPYGWSIFRLWKYFPWMPTALTEILRWVWGWALKISCISTWYNQIYFGVDTWIWYKVDSINLDSPVATYTDATGYIVSQIYTWWDTSVIKTLDEIGIWYSCDWNNPYFPHWWAFKIFGRTSPWNSWTQIWANYTKTDIWQVTITSNEIKAANMGDFLQLELKVEITRWSSTRSPLITFIKVSYDDNVNI